MIVPPLPVDNTQTPISPNGSLPPTGQLILHRQIQVRTVSGTNKLRFSAESFGDITNTNIETYATALARRHTTDPSRKSVDRTTPASVISTLYRSFVDPYRKHTPLDINPNKTCFILIELDPSTNWVFMPGQASVTAKSDKFTTEDAGLHYVTANGVIGPTHPDYRLGAPDDCHIVYWSVLTRKRANSPDNEILRGFNFYVDFRQMVTVNGQDYEHRMPTIFDPNVPNSGGSEFP